MSFLGNLEADNLLAIEGDLAHDLVLTPPQPGAPVVCRGLFDATDMSKDPMAGGLLVPMGKASVTIRTFRIAGLTIDDTWIVTVKLDGVTVYRGVPLIPRVDHTNGVTLIELKAAV